MSITSKRVKAILAGGLVLGVGAAVTLAAWNDSEFASGSFSSGTFDMVGSADGTSFTSHAASPGAPLTFSAGFNNLSPNTTVAAPFVVHLTPATTSDAVVSLFSATGSGTAAANLSYGVIRVASVAACTPAATGTTVVPALTTMSSVTGATSFPLVKSTDNVLDGANVVLCIQVTAASGLAQNTTATGIWQFQAVSTS